MSVNKRLANGTLMPIAGLGTYDNNDLKQYTTLPTASSANEGLIVQYAGTDSTNYSIGGIYQCQEDSGTYDWILLQQEIEVDDAISSTSENPVQNKVISTALDEKIDASLKGSVNGVAELDETGKVPISQLPATMSRLEKYATRSVFPATGDDNTLYVALDTNYTYRWTGSDYVQIDESIQLGETASTAYRGDRGKTAYDHSQTTSGNPHNVTKSDVGLGNVGNFKAVSTVASQGLTDTEKSNARTNIGAGTSSLTIGTTASTAAAGNHTHTLNIAAGGTASINLAANTAYTLTAGGSTYVFKTPSDANSVTGVKGNSESSYRTGNVNITASNIGLGNVGNFKAVSTVASQGLSTTEQTNARNNIGAAAASSITNMQEQYYQTAEPSPSKVGAVWIG